MQKIFYMNSIRKGNKLGHRMLTGITEMKYMCSSFIQACMCIPRAETSDCIRQSPQKHKHFRLRASALQHSVLQVLWEVSGDIMATDCLSDLSLHLSHAMVRFAYQLSDCFLTMCC